MTKIKKILIANRGEIACRVIKTARKMGIKTVAVYSDADRKALHVRMADEAVHIGPSPAAESYLSADKIIDACKSSGADAVHPGYGFLSENPAFARRLRKEGITFIGPAPESMEAMGLKDAAKTLMTAAGVPVTPGYQDDNQDPKHLKKAADDIGYPVLIKAVAGGGGKGMRKVGASEDFIDALASCQREAKSSFGNDIVLIEKYITSPRHIEVQVFGDTHGNVVHMYERDCSLQRRHQKVIEEAPAPGMTDAVRKAMTDAAVNAAKAVNYVGAGTVEFIVDGSGTLKEDGFWFMEMNTRLQVEHPVTEMITGLDLVELQIRVAQGEKLPAQKDISIDGHAIEARLYAEDPANDFLPSIGKIGYINIDGADEFRVDSGVECGSRISIYYDPMIAKIIGHGSTRSDAINNTIYGIAEVDCMEITTNSAFLNSCLLNEDFISGDISTAFIPSNLETLLGENYAERDELYAIAAIKLQEKQQSSKHPFETFDGWRPNLPARSGYLFDRNGETVIVKTLEEGDIFIKVKVNDNTPFLIYLLPDRETNHPGKSLYHYHDWEHLVKDDHVRLRIQGFTYKIPFINHDADVSAFGGNAITAPMPGKIISVEAKVGDAVKAGDKLIVMEAMKMEMSLDAPRDGVIASVNVSTDDLVSDGDVLLELEKEE